MRQILLQVLPQVPLQVLPPVLLQDPNAGPFANSAAIPSLRRMRPRADRLAHRMFHVKHPFADDPANRLRTDQGTAQTVPIQLQPVPPAPIRLRDSNPRATKATPGARPADRDPSAQASEPPSANLASDKSYSKLTPPSEQDELA